MAKEFGCWWECGDVYILSSKADSRRGLRAEEADAIAPQVTAACEQLIRAGRGYGHKLVQVGGERFYVLVESVLVANRGYVKLPILSDNSPPRTDDKSRIPTFSQGRDFG